MTVQPTLTKCLSALSLSLLLLSLINCARLPEEQLPSPTYAIAPDTEAILSTLETIDTAGCGPTCSGFAVLGRGEDALRWRLVMADTARESIDAQYYIWHDDASGLLMLNRLLLAADRGVRVRLLIDDTELLGSRKDVAALNLHPNVELRTFNPFVSKTLLGFSRALEFAIHMDRLNHRMHNKLMVADNKVAIMGGRNIGDQYFGLNPDLNYRMKTAACPGNPVRERAPHRLIEASDSAFRTGCCHRDSLRNRFSLAKCRPKRRARLSSKKIIMLLRRRSP
jgi:putative cardiolipin synthase